MTIRTQFISVLALVLSACGDGADAPEVQPGSSASTFQVTSFDPSAGELPEGLAVKDGRAYVGFAPLAEIVRVDLRSGKLEPFANLPKPAPNKGFTLGLTFGPSRDLYVALVSFDPAVEAGIYRVPPSGGNAQLFAKDPRMAFPNGLLFDAHGDLFVSDSGGAIFKIARDGAVSSWATSALLKGDVEACGGSGNPFPIGANGITAAGGALFATNTDKGSIVRVAIQADGSAAEPDLLIGPDCAALAGADGLTTDPNGNFVVAVNRQNKVVSVAETGMSTSVLASGEAIDFPASIVWNDNRLLLTNFALANASSGKPAKSGLVSVSKGP